MVKQRAFTLIEVLVTIGVITLLIAILIPALSGARESARRASCASNLKQIHMGITNLAADNQGELLSAYEYDSGGTPVWRQVSVSREAARQLAEVGLAESEAMPSEALRCPSSEKPLDWTGTNPTELELGYQYMGGIETWENDSGTFESRSPIRMGRSRGSWVLAADRATFIDDDGVWDNLTHAASDGAPEGQNQVYVNGSVEWVDREDLVFVHSGGPPANAALTGSYFGLFMAQEDLGEFEDAVGPGDMMTNYVN